MKKTILYCLFFATFHGIQAEESIYETDEFDFLGDIDPSLITRDDSCVSKQDVINSLLEIGIVNAIQHDIYCVTNQPQQRSVLRLPATTIYFGRTDNWGFGFNFFYNQTLKQYFTAHSPFIGSYIQLNRNSDFFQELELDGLLTEDQLKFPEVIELFSTIKLQERRCGFILGGHKKHNNFAFTIEVPFYWLEQNFFITQDEVDRIQGAPLFQNAGAGNDESGTKAFFMKHLVSTKFGIGDLELLGEYTGVQTDCSNLTVGARFIAPTAAAIDGRRSELWFGDILLFGGRFCLSAPPYPFDFYEIFKLVLCAPPSEETKAKQAAYDIATNFAVGALDKLTANVADMPLGQRHFSLGPTLEYTYQAGTRTSIVTKGILEYFFPRKETRLFLVNLPAIDFVRNYSNPEDDPVVADENMAFINEQFINTFYPTPACVKVHPGISAEWYIAAVYDSRGAHAEFGYDFWFQGKEHITANTYTQARHLNIDKGIKPWAYQSKLFVKIIGNCNNWHLGLQTDITVDSRGIGKDVTLAANYTMDF